MLGNDRPEGLVKIDRAIGKSLDVKVAALDGKAGLFRTTHENLPEVPAECRPRSSEQPISLRIVEDDVRDFGGLKPRETNGAKLDRAGGENLVGLGRHSPLHDRKCQQPRKGSG